MKIILAGLGLTKGDISVNALEAISSCDRVFVRSLVPESGKILQERGINVSSFDDLFLNSRNFDTLNKKIAKSVLSVAKECNVAYCVDGSVSEDAACAEILKRAKSVQVFDAASRSDCMIANSVNRGAFTCVSAYSADKLNAATLLPLVVYDIDDAYLAGELKLKLCDLFGDERSAVVFARGEKRNIKLYELDRLDCYGYDCSVMVNDSDLTEKTRFSVEDLYTILRVLRSENGCPWDRVQTRESITPNLLEECYELYDALKLNDTENIIEESGDVLLQLAFHSLFGEEAHEFNSTDVVSGVCRKLIDRHTHVFGEAKAADGESALAVWEQNKKKEKKYSGVADYAASVPRAFPALMRAQKVQKRAAKYNFDFSNIEQIYKKIDEERDEIKNANSQENAFEEVGDLLFSVVNLARFLKVDAEEALAGSVEKFLQRLEKAEKIALNSGEKTDELSAEKWDEYYDAAKKD